MPQFESGSFTFRELPVLGTVCIPYPVPFKLLGDEAKGWCAQCAGALLARPGEPRFAGLTPCTSHQDCA